MDKQNKIIINVVNVREADMPNAIKFCIFHNIPLHIMKLQLSNNALKNKDLLTPIDISITGEKGCDINNKTLIMPNGKIIRCASEKSNIKCEYGCHDI